MFKHLENLNKPIEDERTIRVLNMFYATVLFALMGFPVKWCALGFAGYIYTEAMRFESEQRICMDLEDKRIDDILKMEKIPLSDDDEDDEISSYTKNTGMGAVGLADGRHIKFGDSDEEDDEDGEEDSDYDPNRDSQPETDDEQADEQAEQSDEDSTDEFIKNVDKMFNVKVGRENVVKNPLYKKNQEEEFTMISGDDLSGNKAVESGACIMC